VARALSKLGIASRTVAAQWVAAGRVSVNGRIVRDPETPVVPGRDRLQLDGAAVRAATRRYLMLNKPRGLVTTARDEHGRDTVYSCLDPAAQRLAPVGRLDKASEGLLLFSNDTCWAQRLLDPAAQVPKVYHVQIGRPADAALLNVLCRGVRLEDGSLWKVSAARRLRGGEKRSWLEIVLHEGRNRHIRRLLAALEVEVLRLVRVALGPLRLGQLPKGQSRELTAAELKALAALTDSRESQPD
jgi:23S rRNA pseudouridine2605 synthase